MVPPPLSSSFPYKVDYNDHFETPLIAYEHILPLLDAVGPSPTNSNNNTNQTRKTQHKSPQSPQGTEEATSAPTTTTHTNTLERNKHIIYDPYYCNGRTGQLLRQLGFTNVRHEKRDFYADVRKGTVPNHHTLVTNPPFSGDHKERCVRFAVDQLTGGGGGAKRKPFFLLMPNYVATKEYFRNATSFANAREDAVIAYVVPPIPYEYDHPEGTGKDVPPFFSVWFCGLPRSMLDGARDAFRRCFGEHSVLGGGNDDGVPERKLLNTTNTNVPRMVFDLKDLELIGAISSAKRRNPKQRRKEKRSRFPTSAVNDNEGKAFVKLKPNSEDGNRKSSTHQSDSKVISKMNQETSNNSVGKKKKSIYRDENGHRKKRRF